MKRLLDFTILLLAVVLWDGLTYLTYDPVIIQWDPPSGAVDTYDVRVTEWNRTIPATYDFTTTTHAITIQRPSSGWFEIWVRGRNSSGAAEWAKSTVLEDTGGRWLIYWDVPPVGSGGIE